MRAVAVIPARYASTRLPGKPLLAVAGKTMLQYVFEGCRGSARVERVLIATDDARIAEAAAAFGAEVALTAAHHPSGSDRVAEVARELDADVVVNVQGDEVQIDPRDLDLLVERLEADPEAAVATLATPLTRLEDLSDPNQVKVVCDGRGRALYFSRAAIPTGSTLEDSAAPGAAPPLKHRGVYAYRREALLRLADQEPAPLERAERLEQLRALHCGMVIQVAHTPRDGIEVNTREDFERFAASCARNGNGERSW